MKKLLLTSGGFTNKTIVDSFQKLVGKELKEIKLLYIPVATNSNEYIIFIKNQIISYGVKEENITHFNLDRSMSVNELNEYDAVFVGGGNTFYLLHKIREIGFDKSLIKAIEKGLVYVGVSAGSIVAGPTSVCATPFDPNTIGMVDFTGMKITDTIIIPHFSEQREAIVANFKKNLSNSIVTVKDSQALEVIGESSQIVGE